ncbi:MAG: AclJ, partial [uncultured Blastococcus sp.]
GSGRVRAEPGALGARGGRASRTDRGGAAGAIGGPAHHGRRAQRPGPQDPADAGRARRDVCGRRVDQGRRPPPGLVRERAGPPTGDPARREPGPGPGGPGGDGGGAVPVVVPGVHGLPVLRGLPATDPAADSRPPAGTGAGHCTAASGGGSRWV